jgi:antitoxin FitA
MCSTCLYAGNMSKMIQVRDVPDQIHNALKARAAGEGMSLSDFVKKELERVAELPTMREWLDRTQLARPIRKSCPRRLSRCRAAHEWRPGRITQTRSGFEG